MSLPGVLRNFWDDNSLSWTTNLDASHGINLNRDLLDKTGAPAEFLPYLPWESKFNYEHNNNHCTVKPCGAQLAMRSPRREPWSFWCVLKCSVNWPMRSLNNAIWTSGLPVSVGCVA